MLVLLLASPLAPSALAPGPQELDAAVAGMHDRVTRMEAIGDALGRVQNRWGEQLAAGGKPDPCESPAAADLVARSRALGAAYRDSVQSARAQLDRLERLWAAPTVTPLLDREDRARADTFRTAVQEHVRVVLEAAAWQSAHVEPAARRCQELALTVAPGIPYDGALAANPVEPVAVIGLGAGLVCPGALPAEGVIVVPEGLACWSESSCDCTPQPVLPAAVLGPSAP